MKSFSMIVKSILPLFFIGLFSPVANSQDQSIKSILETRQYIFRAESAISNGGISRQLSSGYDIIINKTMAQVYLPYFGKAFGSPTDLNNRGFQFTSMSFNYNITDSKKGGWEITIKPEDATDVSNMTLTIFNDASASLEINSLQRETISYTGYIEHLKSKK